MPSSCSPYCLLRAPRAFTLVEVALALGIASFILAGLLGVIPLASSVSRQSITQSRAAGIASTIFANFRAQKFSAASCLDDGSDALNLNTLTTASGPTTYYAYFDEAVTSVTSGSDERRLHFLSQSSVGSSPAGPSNNPLFRIILRFNNNPPGTFAPTAANPHAEANAVEASICAVASSKDVYRFSSVVANRSE